LRALLDQELPYSTVTHLQSLGWDVVHTVDVGMQRAADQTIIDYAREQQRLYITLDADFHSIIATAGLSSPSVIRIRRQSLTGMECARLIHHVYVQVRQDIETGAFVTVTKDKIRVGRLSV
jgi:predicted nuclease of predicted toxin-antitoxin system